MQTYEMVDKHIRRLDADLARFESELKRNILISKQEEVTGVGGVNSANDGGNSGAERKNKKSESEKDKKKRSKDDEATLKSAKKKRKVIFPKQTKQKQTTKQQTKNSPNLICLCFRLKKFLLEKLKLLPLPNRIYKT